MAGTYSVSEPEAERKNQLKLSTPQSKVFTANTPLILDMAGQGSGKTQNIGIDSGHMVINFPRAKGFIAANTYLQLNQSTLIRVFSIWSKHYGLKEFDKNNIDGHYVIDKIPPPHFKKYEKLKTYHNTISFLNGALIFVGSLDNYKAHDGKEFAWAHLDETKDTKKEALTSVILARLRQFGLWVQPNGQRLWDDDIEPDEVEERGLKSWNPCFIHTSPAEGGVDWIIEMFDLSNDEQEIRNLLLAERYFFKKDDQKTVVIYPTHWNWRNLPPDYIETRKAQQSENEQLKYIYGYPFSKTGGEYFPAFERKKHVSKVEYEKGKAVHLTYDFNVMPYITQIAGQVEYVGRYWDPITRTRHNEPGDGKIFLDVMQIRIFREYCMKTPLNSTEAACDAFRNDVSEIDLENTLLDVFVYGDASGRNRITGLPHLTQYKIIEGKLREYLPNNYLRVPLANMARLKRRDLVNRILENKIPEVELIIDESCKEVIRDFEFVKLDVDGKLKEKAKDPDSGVKYEKIGHTSDAVEYLICELCKQYLRDF